MSVYYQLYKAECVQRTLSVALCAWGLCSLFMLSPVCRILNVAVMFCSVLLWILYLCMPARRGGEIIKEVRRVNADRLLQIRKYMLIVSSVLFLAATVWNIVRYAGKSFCDLYEIVVAVSDFCLPLLFFVLPVCVHQYYSAFRANGTDSRCGRRRIRRLSGVNVILLAAAVLLSYFMMFYASSAIVKTSSEYKQGANRVQTHTLDYVIALKNTVTDAQSGEILLDSLPLGDKKSEVSYLDQTLYISYTDIPESDIKQAVVYNSTMLFALQDDLLCIQWDINGVSYTVRRYRVTTEYDNFAQILTGSVWMEQLKRPIADEAFVAAKFEKFVGLC